MKPFHSLKLLCVALVSSVATVAYAQNIVSDPGFEASADGSGAHPFSASWTVNNTSGGPAPGLPGSNENVGGDPSFAHTGNNYANLGSVGSVSTLSQMLTTTVGGRYTFSFWLANNSNIPTNSFSASFGGSLVFATTSPPFSSGGNYVLMTFSNLLATSTSTLLQFSFRHDDDFWRLDDISVTAAPEGGATLWLAVPALAGLCLVHARVRGGKRLLS